ncbi:MAG TPA: MoaD/ThiS family protein [Planctomycetota bacterium]|nr:MoaD/ThiS family protein [Planctomycetota bacterium]
MPRVTFTPNLQRHVECPPATAPGSTVHDVLESVFAGNPRLRGYLLDEQGAVRHHVVIFVDGTSIRDRQALSDAVTEGSEVYVMQALSGG